MAALAQLKLTLGLSCAKRTGRSLAERHEVEDGNDSCRPAATNPPNLETDKAFQIISLSSVAHRDQKLHDERAQMVEEIDYRERCIEKAYVRFGRVWGDTLAVMRARRFFKELQKIVRANKLRAQAMPNATMCIKMLFRNNLAEAFQNWSKYTRQKVAGKKPLANIAQKRHRLSQEYPVFACFFAWIDAVVEEKEDFLARMRSMDEPIKKLHMKAQERNDHEESETIRYNKEIEVEKLRIETTKAMVKQLESELAHTSKVFHLENRVLSLVDFVRTKAVPPARYIVYPPRNPEKGETVDATHRNTHISLAAGEHPCGHVPDPLQRHWTMAPNGEARLFGEAYLGFSKLPSETLKTDQGVQSALRKSKSAKAAKFRDPPSPKKRMTSGYRNR